MALAVLKQPVCLPREGGKLDSGIEMDAFLRDVQTRAYRITLTRVRDANEALDIVQDTMKFPTGRYANLVAIRA